MSFDFAAVNSPFRMQPGLRRLAVGAKQLTPSTRHSQTLTEKLNALHSSWHEALVSIERFDPQPALHDLFAQAAREHPHAWQWDGHVAQAATLGWQVDVSNGELSATAAADERVGACLTQLPAHWLAAALLACAFEEDIAIIDATTGCVPWMAVCLPSSWSPAEKVGLHFTQIHAPVADNAALLAATSGLLRVITAEPRVERFVWTVTPHRWLNAHPRVSAASAWPDSAHAQQIARAAYWRTERQTFIPVPATSQAIFTIGIAVQPMIDAVDSAAKARAIHDALVSMSPAVLAYRRLTAVREPLLRWLAERANAA